VATAVYREADVELDVKGLILKPSRPPVAPRQLALGGGRPAVTRIQLGDGYL
jgi:hypothetical protein